MRNYFIAGLGSHHLAVIRNAGVSYSEFDYNGTRGILVDEGPALETALTAINAHVVQEDVTTFDGIYALVLASGIGEAPVTRSSPIPAPTPATLLNVRYDGWSGDTHHDRTIFQRMLEELLLPVVQKRIVFSGCESGVTRGPRSDGIFRVMLWSGAYSEKGSGDSSSLAWGFKVGVGRDCWYATSGEGITIRVPENEAAIAEILGDNLYVFIPVNYYKFAEGPKIFRRILEEVVAELSLSPVQKAERERQRAEAERVRLQREHAEARIQYISLCRQRLQQVVDEARHRVSEGAQALQETQATIVVTTRELIGCNRKLEQLRKLKEEEDRRFAAEFDKICGLPQVEDVLMCDGNVLHIMTKTLTFKDPSNGTVHELGKYRIEIPVNGGNVRWINLTRQVDGLETGMQSPVVDANGCTILINAIQAFPELIANYEIAQAVQLALQVPGAIDPSEEHAKHLSNWPVASAA